MAQASAPATRTSAAQPGPDAYCLSFAYLDKGPVRIRYIDTGSGFPLLLIPGGGWNSRITQFTQPFHVDANPIPRFGLSVKVLLGPRYSFARFGGLGGARAVAPLLFGPWSVRKAVFRMPGGARYKNFAYLLVE